MGEMVNLRLARKRSERERKAVEADANRAAFGRSKSARQSAQRERERAESHLEGHRLLPSEKGDSSDDEAGRPSAR